ncbi:hypothetical protein BU17DRAFT_81163 [Hysterangium stoloniferum]|nr:hypothetical protein BU17DRAFT_81163 [Hysterangium stoloniferum]
MQRCKCGGTAVAPTVPLNRSPEKGVPSDRWAKTYVSKANGQQPTSPVKKEAEPPHAPQPYSQTRPSRRFPRPQSTTDITISSSFSSAKISDHIASVTTPRERTSPTRKGVLDSPGSSPADVITSPDNTTLAKAYGSILQPPETLPIHTCGICASIFSPDATIYPDLQATPGTATRFLCRPCFTANGGVKGDCSACGREVTIIKKDGGFIECSGMVWHKRCFRCDNCHKDIGHAPMVDLYGNPSCEDCFNTCTRRKSTPKKTLSELTNNIGGMKGRSRESSPALEELSDRLGISRHSSRDVFSDGGGSLLKHPIALSPSSPSNSTSTLSHFKSADSADSPHQSPSTAARSTKRIASLVKSINNLTPKEKVVLTPLKISATENSKCDICLQYLFKNHGDGKIITVPESDDSQNSFHASCFRCFVCNDDFNTKSGQAVFIRDARGVRHPECVTRDDTTRYRRESPSRLAPLSESPTEQLPKTAPADSGTFPRYGKSEACPGCHKSVSAMEYGVVTGPQNSRWHAACLVCGGKGAKLPRPGCGKKLDSGAKIDVGGVVWCRECMVRRIRPMFLFIN